MRVPRPTAFRAAVAVSAVVVAGGITAVVLAASGGSTPSGGTAAPANANSTAVLDSPLLSATPTGPPGAAHVASPEGQGVTAKATPGQGMTSAPARGSVVTPTAPLTPTVGFGDTPSLGVVLTDPSGLTLYWYDGDIGGRAVCTGTCLKGWTPYTVPAGATLRAPAAGMLGTLTLVNRPGGGSQVAYNGHPLYRYVGDPGPASTNGDGLSGPAGHWHAYQRDR